MHRVLPPPAEATRPCVFCDQPVLQIKGRIATNRNLGYGKTGMAHEECWAMDKMASHESVSNSRTD